MTDSSPPQPSEHMISISDEMRKSYLDYAMSVIVSRALPDVRDGLKPVHRRILYAMMEGGYDWSKPPRKSARVVGDVMGNYHPHGDSSIYEAMVRMAQDFSMRLPLVDGQGNFGTQQIVTSTVTNGRSVFAEDIDGDDDMDLVCASYGDSSIVWFENLDGQGTFSAEKIIAPPDVTAGVNELICIDLDGDNDLDVLSAYTQDDRISWYENLDGLGTFGSERILTEIAGLPTSIYAVDLDNDDDIDVISAGADSVEGVVAWYQNLDGLGTFGPQEIVEDNSNGTRSVFSEDIDDDGDNDILTSLWWENTINWHENYTILGNVDFEESLISIYPNPTSNLLTIQNQNGLDIESVSLYDALGRKVMENTESTEAIDISNLTTGIYFIHIATDSGIVTKNVIKE